jgi:hypothetical protein
MEDTTRARPPLLFSQAMSLLISTTQDNPDVLWDVVRSVIQVVILHAIELWQQR